MSALALHAHASLAFEFVLSFFLVLEPVADRLRVAILRTLGRRLALELMLSFLMLFLLDALGLIAVEVDMDVGRTLASLHVLGAMRRLECHIFAALKRLRDLAALRLLGRLGFLHLHARSLECRLTFRAAGTKHLEQCTWFSFLCFHRSLS